MKFFASQMRDQSGIGLVQALMGSAILIGAVMVVSDAINSQRKNLVNQESRTVFIQSRFTVGEMIRARGGEICKELGFGASANREAPDNAKAKEYKDARSVNPGASVPEIFNQKYLNVEPYASSILLAGIREVTPLGVVPLFEFDLDNYQCVPDAIDAKYEICSSNLLFKGSFPKGQIAPTADKYPLSLRVLTTGQSRTLESCNLGNAKAKAASPIAVTNYERIGVVKLGEKNYDLGSDFKRITFLGHLELGDASPFGGFILRQSDNTYRAVLTAEGRHYGDFVVDQFNRCIWLDGKTYIDKVDSPACLKLDTDGKVRLSLGPYVRTTFVAEGLAQAPAAQPTPSQPNSPAEPAFEALEVICTTGTCPATCPNNKRIIALSLSPPQMAKPSLDGKGMICNSSLQSAIAATTGAKTCRGVCY